MCAFLREQQGTFEFPDFYMRIWRKVKEEKGNSQFLDLPGINNEKTPVSHWQVYLGISSTAGRLSSMTHLSLISLLITLRDLCCATVCQRQFEEWSPMAGLLFSTLSTKSFPSFASTREETATEILSPPSKIRKKVRCDVNSRFW